jgi:hypothetical protein
MTKVFLTCKGDMILGWLVIAEIDFELEGFSPLPRFFFLE